MKFRNIIKQLKLLKKINRVFTLMPPKMLDFLSMLHYLQNVKKYRTLRAIGYIIYKIFEKILVRGFYYLQNCQNFVFAVLLFTKMCRKTNSCLDRFLTVSPLITSKNPKHF